MKRNIVLVLLISVLVFATGVPCFAAAEAGSTEPATEIIYYEDGSYAVLETIVDEVDSCEPGIAPMAAYKTKSGTSKYTYHNKSGAAAWTLTLNGSFKYNGSTAQATSASASHTILINGWSCSKKNVTKSGASAKVDGTFRYATLTPDITIKLTCSANGTITAKAY